MNDELKTREQLIEELQALRRQNSQLQHYLNQSLQVSRERLALVLEAAQLGVWYCDLPFDRLEWNDKCKEHFGIALEVEVDIALFYERLHPDDRARTSLAIEQSIADNTAYDIEYRTVGLDGQLRWIRAIGRGFLDAEGKPVRFDGITIDMTERKHSELALKESEQWLKLSLATGKLGAWQLDLVSGKLATSELCKAHFGLAPGLEVSYQMLLTAIHPEDRPIVSEAVARALAEQTDFEAEYRTIWPDGSLNWMTAHGRAFYSPDGRPLRMVGVTLDTTDRKRSEVERTRLLADERLARAEAEAANRTKDEFLAMLSHELRTPLNPIVGFSQVLRRGQPDAMMMGRALEIIERNGKLLTRLIDDILDVSRIIRGKLNIERQPLELLPVIGAAIEAIRLVADEKQIVLCSELAAVGPIWGDSTRLSQVVWNLLTNAIKFTPAGGRIEVHLDEFDTGIQIAVSDTGQGIDPEFLPHVFDRFRQADSTSTRTQGGLGLGLAIVRHIVELHGGTVQVDSPGIGKGATFTVHLPRSTVGVPSSTQSLSHTPRSL